MEPAQFARDCNVAAGVTKANRRGEIENALSRFEGAGSFLLADADAKPALDEIRDHCICLGRIAAERIVPAAPERDELPARHLGVRSLRPFVGLDLVVVAV